MGIRFTLSIILIVLSTLIYKSVVNAAHSKRTIAKPKCEVARVFEHLNNSNWREAEKIAKNLANLALIKIVLSQKFLNSNCSNNRFEEVVEFLKTNPHWPQYAKLTEKAEEYLNDNTNKKVILEWFSKHPPISSKGYKFYALATTKLLTSNQPELTEIIKNGWIYGDFTLGEERQYFSQFGQYLSEEDHVKRVDQQLWKADIKEAKRSMDLVSSGYRQAFEAEIAAMQNSNFKEHLFRKVPEKYYTSGLLYHYLKSKKKEVPTSRAVALFQKVKTDKMHSHEWCNLQIYYAREFIEQQDFASSYKIISQHLAVETADIREAEWLAGWLALRFLKKPETALRHFTKLLTIVRTPISSARANYWLARTYDAKSDKEKANKYYKAASHHSHTFYGQIAAIELNQPRLALPPMPKLELHHKKAVENNDVVKAAKLLIKYGKTDLAHLYLKSAVERASLPELMWLAEIVKANGSPYYITEFGKHASYNHLLLKDFAFPTPYKISNFPVEAALTYAIIRQESVFNQYAISPAKAIGLMQLVKDTACRTAKTIPVKCDVARLTKDPKYNIKLGTSHLRELLKERNGSYIVTLSSYNTTTTNANKWIKRFGDPRKMKNYRDVIDWIELIPFAETRNYVQRVLENLQVYRAILNKGSRLRLKQDLIK